MCCPWQQLWHFAFCLRPCPSPSPGSNGQITSITPSPGVLGATPSSLTITYTPAAGITVGTGTVVISSGAVALFKSGQLTSPPNIPIGSTSCTLPMPLAVPSAVPSFVCADGDVLGASLWTGRGMCLKYSNTEGNSLRFFLDDPLCNWPAGQSPGAWLVVAMVQCKFHVTPWHVFSC